VLVRDRDFVEAPRRVDALQLELAAVYELGARGAEHTMHGLRREDATRRRDALNALGDDHRLAVEVAAVLDHLARVEADTHDGSLRGVFAVAAVDRDLDLACTRHRPAGRLECDHEAIAEPLHHDAALAFDQLQRNLLELTPKRVRSVVPELLVQLSRLDEVGEQHRDGALGQRRGG